MTTVELTMRDVERDKDALHAWLRAHDLDPNRTMPGVVARDGRVSATLYVRDDKGQVVVERDECTGDVIGPKTEDVDIELREPVPAGLGTVLA